MKEVKLIIMAVFLSLLFTLTVIRGCFSGVVPTLICGNSLNSNNVFMKLQPENLVATSVIPESLEYSIKNNLSAKNLVDGSETTVAAPASKTLDYIIDLLSLYQVKKVIINWGDFGISKQYIDQWALEASKNGEDWLVMMNEEKSPGEKSVIDATFVAKMLRIKAASEKNWIGIHEVEIIAKPL